MTSAFPGPIRQAGYVVRDIDAAIAGWCRVGVGPWFTLRDLTQTLRYRGELVEVVLHLAMANSGSLQIELIQQVNDAPSAYREFLDSGGEGFHHYSFWPDDVAAARKTVEAAGWELIQESSSGVSTPFAYYAADGMTSTVHEISQLSEGVVGLDRMLTEAAAAWDGVTDPVRSLR